MTKRKFFTNTDHVVNILESVFLIRPKTRDSTLQIQFSFRILMKRKTILLTTFTFDLIQTTNLIPYILTAFSLYTVWSFYYTYTYSERYIQYWVLPSLLMPIFRHFFNLQNWHWLRWCWSIGQFLFPRHEYVKLRRTDLLKKDLQPIITNKVNYFQDIKHMESLQI